MTDPSDLVTPRRRRGALVLLSLYGVLVVGEIATGNPVLGAAADLLIGAFAIAVSGFFLVQFWQQGTSDWVVPAATAAVLVAGLTTGYVGLARLELVPFSSVIQTVGTVALLVAIGLYLYWRTR